MKFEKIITINESLEDVGYLKYIHILLDFMKRHNEENSSLTQYFSIRTRDSRVLGATDLVLEWITEKNE